MTLESKMMPIVFMVNIVAILASHALPIWYTTTPPMGSVSRILFSMVFATVTVAAVAFNKNAFDSTMRLTARFGLGGEVNPVSRFLIAKLGNRGWVPYIIVIIVVMVFLSGTGFQGLTTASLSTMILFLDWRHDVRVERNVAEMMSEFQGGEDR